MTLKKYFLLVLVSMLTTHIAFAQTFRSAGNGNWTSIHTWQHFDGENWSEATSFPGQTGSDAQVTIQASHQVYINPGSNIQIHNLYIKPEGRLTIYKKGKIIISNKIDLSQSAIAAILVENETPHGTITSLDCDDIVLSGSIGIGDPLEGIVFEVNYTGGNNQNHFGQTVYSTGVTGLVAVLESGTFDSGDGTLIYSITGVPSNSGVASFSLQIGGIGCTIELDIHPGFDPGAIATTGETICHDSSPQTIIANATEATGGSGTIAYRWQQSENAEFSAPTNISHDAASYTPSINLTADTWFRRQANDETSPENWVTSAGTWKVSVYEAFSAGAIATSGETIDYNESPQNEIAGTTDASGGDGQIEYRWQRSDNAGFTAPTNIDYDAASYTPTQNLTANTWYRRQARDRACQTEWVSSDGIWKVTVEAMGDEPGFNTCGDILTDMDGNQYNTIRMGTQCWMAENLKTTTYHDGTPIPNLTVNADWEGTTSGAYAWYDNDMDNKDLYGALYNRYAVENSAGLCPDGWHAPTNSEWLALRTYLANLGYPNDRDDPAGAGNALKSTRTEPDPHPRWSTDPIHSGLDAFGFSGLPGGRRLSDGIFANIGDQNLFWNSSSSLYGLFGYLIAMYYDRGSILINERTGTHRFGLSVRCIRDASADFTFHQLQLFKNPSSPYAIVRGAGQYLEEETIHITASTSEIGWFFVNWTGDTQHVADPNASHTTITMPAGDVSLTANFELRTAEIHISANPVDGGYFIGAGAHPQGSEVTVNAIPYAGWVFDSWSGDTGVLDDVNVPINTFIILDEDITLTAHFVEFECGMPIWDADGNAYQTVQIGNQCWMAENLKTTTYQNYTPIPYVPDGSAWSSTDEGAYAIYPHTDVDGIESDAEMAAAYGNIYNLHAVYNPAGLCPPGWEVPSNAMWNLLEVYATSQGYPNDDVDNRNGTGNALKSIRTEPDSHPRWYVWHPWIKGLDIFGFAALPSGIRRSNGWWIGLETRTQFWALKENQQGDVRELNNNWATMQHYPETPGTGSSVRCIQTAEQAKYDLQLDVYPEGSGTTTGSGEYMAGQLVNISANANEGQEFVRWSGDTYLVDSEFSASTFLPIMPDRTVNLTANFKHVPIYGDGVTDIDGNNYQTVIIGEQEWMARNLRTTKYQDGSPIPTNLGDSDWANTQDGAYAIYPHTPWNVSGIDSPEEMVEAYGKLYNWHAVNDTRGLCPAGWFVPSHDDWSSLLAFYEEKGFPNETANASGMANALKSCRQLDSPLGSACDVDLHPTWVSLNPETTIHYGFDEFGFAALPGGSRPTDGAFDFDIGLFGLWWSSSLGNEPAYARYVQISADNSHVILPTSEKTLGSSVRCIRGNFALNINASPENGGIVTGAGNYRYGEPVSLSATAAAGMEFVGWAGDTQYLDDPLATSITLEMPDSPVSLTAVFRHEIIDGSGMADVDENHYATVIIDGWEWMAENLRVLHYNNGDPITTNLSDEIWNNTTEGAYAMYPHHEIDGLDSDTEVLNAYGALYNWHVVNDSRGICPTGWHVPGNYRWTMLERFICNQLGNTGCDEEFPYPRLSGYAGTNEGNALKSCNQIESLLEEACSSEEHPRWNSHATHFGRGDFGFSVMPNGARNPDGNFLGLGTLGTSWTSTQSIASAAYGRSTYNNRGDIRNGNWDQQMGRGIRCVKDQHWLTLETNFPGAGSVSGAGNYAGGEQIPISTTANSGWMFSGWTDHLGGQVSSEASFMYTMPELDVTLTAIFEKGCLTHSDVSPYPEHLFTPVCSGDTETIAIMGKSNEYALVAVVEGQSYEFSLSLDDFITISDENGQEVYAIGTSPLIWTATFSGTVRYYNHLSNACEEDVDGGTRFKHIKCITIP